MAVLDGHRKEIFSNGKIAVIEPLIVIEKKSIEFLVSGRLEYHFGKAPHCSIEQQIEYYFQKDLKYLIFFNIKYISFNELWPNLVAQVIKLKGAVCIADTPKSVIEQILTYTPQVFIYKTVAEALVNQQLLAQKS
ncbi:hypothetical protein [Candidatus Uabimicrobium sp. HlEnr_7]|uniref:hypothetical protein n=1 Tax=Candidatus Uabimicrobium helgolandensis TaxID=3095367 RepID=UPI003557F14E